MRKTARACCVATFLLLSMMSCPGWAVSKLTTDNMCRNSMSVSTQKEANASNNAYNAPNSESGFPSQSSIQVETTIGGDKVNQFTVYTIAQDICSAFISNSSLDLLRRQDEGILIESYSKVSSSGLIRREVINGGLVTVDEMVEGIFRIGISAALPVYASLTDFAGNKAEIEKYLVQNGVSKTIESSIVICAPSFPISIWVNTETEDFFITIDEQPEDYIYNPHKTTYVYRLYTNAEYCSKFSDRKLTLIVNGNAIDAGNHAILRNKDVLLPFTVVMEQLGGKVEWKQNMTEMRLLYNDCEYYFDAKTNSLIEVSSDTSITLPPPGEYRYCKAAGEVIILDGDSMEAALELAGAAMSVNYDELIVEIG